MNDLAKQYEKTMGHRGLTEQFLRSMDYFCVYKLLDRGYPDQAVADYLIVKNYTQNEAKNLVSICRSLGSAMNIIQAHEEVSGG